VDIGDDVRGLRVGDRVALEPGVPCWANPASRYSFMIILVPFEDGCLPCTVIKMCPSSFMLAVRTTKAYSMCLVNFYPVLTL